MTFDNRKNEISLNIHGNVRRRARSPENRALMGTRHEFRSSHGQSRSEIFRQSTSRKIRVHIQSDPRLPSSLTFWNAGWSFVIGFFGVESLSWRHRHQQSVTALNIEARKAVDCYRFLRCRSRCVSWTFDAVLKISGKSILLRNSAEFWSNGTAEHRRPMTLFRQKRVSSSQCLHSCMTLCASLANYLRTKAIKTTLRPRRFFRPKTQAVKFVWKNNYEAREKAVTAVNHISLRASMKSASFNFYFASWSTRFFNFFAHR